MKQIYVALTLLLALGACTQAAPIARDVLIPGPKGDAGQNGAGCTVVNVDASPAVPNGGALISCGSAQSLIRNGDRGPQGEVGPVSAYGIVGIVDPCGDAPGIADEVFLKLENGQLLWLQVSSASALTARLALATPGSYVTTDGSSCYLTVTNTFEVINEHY